MIIESSWLSDLFLLSTLVIPILAYPRLLYTVEFTCEGCKKISKGNFYAEDRATYCLDCLSLLTNEVLKLLKKYNEQARRYIPFTLL